MTSIDKTAIAPIETLATAGACQHALERLHCADAGEEVRGGLARGDICTVLSVEPCKSLIRGNDRDGPPPHADHRRRHRQRV